VDRGSAAVAGDLGVGGLAMGPSDALGVASGPGGIVIKTMMMQLMMMTLKMDARA